MFILVTNAFEKDVYGTFAGVVALGLFVSPFSSFGAGYLVVQRVVGKGEALGRAILRAWITVTAGAVIFGGALLVLRGIVLPQNRGMLLEIVCRLLFPARTAKRFMLSHRKLWIAPDEIIVGFMQVVFAVWYLQIGRPPIEGWLSSMVSVAVGAVSHGDICFRRAINPRPSPARHDLGEVSVLDQRELGHAQGRLDQCCSAMTSGRQLRVLRGYRILASGGAECRLAMRRSPILRRLAQEASRSPSGFGFCDVLTASLLPSRPCRFVLTGFSAILIRAAR